jgi:hypothetical protein
MEVLTLGLKRGGNNTVASNTEWKWAIMQHISSMLVTRSIPELQDMGRPHKVAPASGSPPVLSNCTISTAVIDYIVIWLQMSADRQPPKCYDDNPRQFVWCKTYIFM